MNRYRFKQVALLMATLAWGWSAPALADATAHRHEHAVAGKAQRLGQKMVTDEGVRAGMDDIRRAVLARRADMEADRMTAQDYQRLAAQVDQSLMGIVKNCKLPAEADNAFHTVVLADLNRDVLLMRTSPKVAVQRVSAMGIIQTLRHYGDYFSHPGWTMDSPSAP